MTRINNINGPSFSSAPPPISGRDATQPPRKLDKQTDPSYPPSTSRAVLTNATNLPMDGVGPKVLGEALSQGIHEALE